MKKFFTKITVILVLLPLLSQTCTFAQGQVYDAVTIGPGYANQSFYSLSNGEVSNVTNTDWDLAFQIAGFQASILVNHKKNLRLFKSGLDVNDWSNITAADTIGVLNSANELFNQDTSWWTGAFNTTNDINNQFDLGWGIYDFATHAVTGDSLYFLLLPNGVVKKLWIQSLQNSTYFFAHADVDGSNEVNASLNKQNFQGKNFGYYSLTGNVTIDREPVKYLWDITFMQYMATTPFVYKVTGALSNDSVSAVKAYPVDPASVTPWSYPYSNHINTIGYNWKNFDLNNNVWVIEDSTVYFVFDRAGLLWKLQFVGFSGATNGDIEFYKEQISATGLAENGGKPALLGMYPNPASTSFKLVCYLDSHNPNNHAELYDVNGRMVLPVSMPLSPGLQEIQIDTQSLNAGVYFLKLTVYGITTTGRLAIVK